MNVSLFILLLLVGSFHFPSANAEGHKRSNSRVNFNQNKAAKVDVQNFQLRSIEQQEVSVPLTLKQQDLVEQWEIMVEREEKYKLSQGILFKDYEDKDNKLIWREKLIEWAYSVIDHFDMPRSNVALATKYMDLYQDRLAALNGRIGDQVEFKLIAAASILMAVKIDSVGIINAEGETKFKMLSIPNLVQLSRGQFVGEDVEKMEEKICSVLTWLLHPPLASDYLNFLSLLRPTGLQAGDHQAIFQIKELANYLVELAIVDTYLSPYSSYKIAGAAFDVALRLGLKQGLISENLYKYSCLSAKCTKLHRLC